ncbi:MAG: YdeI/OmpD-associated family protein [Candidatus Doudnabacteria bacterium]|nr:YdeI/OmpD-associated family protein [Candidatus Doudnabacteria bacterium]
MVKQNSAKSLPHSLPSDFKKALSGSLKAKAVWEEITPLAKNEWVCWATSGKKEDTRHIRIKKAVSKLSGGMRRPCCWVGCPHRE